jgi:hypothetical protein
LGTFASSASAAAPTIVKTSVSGVSTSSATLEAEINPQGLETEYHFEYGLSPCPAKCTKVPVPDAKIPTGSSPKVVKETIAGLTAGTTYHFRVVAKNGATAISSDRLFVIYASPLEGLPDGRAYEQASPTNKDGGDVVGDFSVTKATPEGNGISFGSTFGIPGGKGAQELPGYLASREGGAWSTQGLLPPPSVGPRARTIGWTPDYSEVFSEAFKLGNPRLKALIGQSTKTQALTVIGPYVAKAEYSLAGTSPDSSSVFFEARAQLPPKAGEPPNPAAIQGALNLYVWNRSSGEVKLAGVFNNGTVPPKGSFAGPYDWARGTNGVTLRQGGGARNYYLQEEHAITPSGDVYFTAGGTGQLYLRRNPTQPQSEMKLNGKGEEECAKAADACTIQVSASHKTDGKGPNGTDAAGEQPAIFQAATEDGSTAFFTSPEKLTNDANTGPEQPLAAIGTANSETGAIENAEFLPKHAVGVAVDAKYIYWADPAKGTIGRAELSNPASANDAFITPGPVEYEVEPGVMESVESTPRYVAVDAEHVYWTNTGRTEANGLPISGTGTIGRAKVIGDEVSEIKPDFIRGASNPEGIAVNATHIYWANAILGGIGTNSIARATLDGGTVDEGFFKTSSGVPRGVALSPTHIYFSYNEEGNDIGYVRRMTLDGEDEVGFVVGKAGVGGVPPN